MITTLDGIAAGVRPGEDILKTGAAMEAAGVWHSLFYTAGSPGAATAPSPGIAGAALTTYGGQIQWVNPASGNTYLARLAATATQPGSLALCDRLWHNSGIAVTTTTAQTVNSTTWPARDQNGATAGDGIMVGIEVSTATTNGSAVTNTTMSYTNQAGTSGRTATIASFPATAVAGTFVPFRLAAGDTGIRSIQSITLGTSYGGGVIHAVAYRKISRIYISQTGGGDAVDALTSGFPQLFDNSVPFLIWVATSTTAVTIAGEVVFTQG